MLLHNIKEKCKERGLNIAQLERAADIQPNSIYKWADINAAGETVGVIPAADKLDRVADVLGTTVKALLYGEEKGGKRA